MSSTQLTQLPQLPQLPETSAIKLIASDVDGTLLNDNFVFGEQTLRVITALQAHHIHFIPATGRTYSALSSVVDCTLFPYVICANGVHLYKREQQDMQLVWDKSFQWSDLALFFSLRETYFPTMHVHVYVQEELVTDRDGPFVSEYERRSGLKFRIVSSFEELKQKEITKIMIIHPHDELKDVQTLLIDKGFNAIFSDVHFLEVINSESSKGRALRHVFELENLEPKNAMAFGDSFNDVSLLKAVAFPLVMKNASADLLPEYSRTEYTNNEDGVARFLIDYFAIVV